MMLARKPVAGQMNQAESPTCSVQEVVSAEDPLVASSRGASASFVEFVVSSMGPLSGSSSRTLSLVVFVGSA